MTAAEDRIWAARGDAIDTLLEVAGRFLALRRKHTRMERCLDEEIGDQFYAAECELLEAATRASKLGAAASESATLVDSIPMIAAAFEESAQ